MEKKVLAFGEKYIVENLFHKYRQSININEVDI